MFHLKISVGYCSKCISPQQIIVRKLQMAFRKKYVRPKKESTIRATSAHLQVLGSGGADQPGSVILQAVDTRYLFNCGEGIGRMSKNAGISLKNIDHAFFTQSKWNCIGGITSVIFSTIASSGYPPTFTGPDNLQKIFQRMSFLSTVGGTFKHRFTDDLFKCERFEDHKIVIEPIELKNLKDSAIIYVCKLKECRGGFSLKKSLDKNVPPHLLGNLHQGESITLVDGTVVNPNEVRNEDWPETYFISEF